MPRPVRYDSTGAPIFSASALISADACAAPPPTQIIGALALATSSASAAIFSGSGSGVGCNGRGSCKVTSDCAGNWSDGTSSATGPGRPDCISWKARATRYGACVARSSFHQSPAVGGGEHFAGFLEIHREQFGVDGLGARLDELGGLGRGRRRGDHRGRDGRDRAHQCRIDRQHAAGGENRQRFARLALDPALATKPASFWIAARPALSASLSMPSSGCCFHASYSVGQFLLDLLELGLDALRRGLRRGGGFLDRHRHSRRGAIGFITASKSARPCWSAST